LYITVLSYNIVETTFKKLEEPRLKLLHISLNDTFEKTIMEWAYDIKSAGNTALFHVYVPYDYKDNLEKLDYIRNILKKEAADIPVIGCSATGEILDGQINDNDIVITAMVFEDPGTKVQVLTSYEQADEFDANALLERTKCISDLKAIEILTAAPYEKLENVGEVIDALPDDIVIFGGVAVGDDKHMPFVFANESPISNTGSAYVIYTGKELHLQANRMFGWKPIGYPLSVTRSEGPVVYELDGKPAFDVYNHYLHIKKGDNFFYDALEFPWEVRINDDTAYIRHAKSVNPDGSIVMSSNIPQGSSIRLTYGDPRRIIDHTKQTILMIHDFAPQVVSIVNCMGRKLFWAENENVEISLISKYMQSTGFSALGEILRHKGISLLNNLSIVAVAMREGPAGKVADIDLVEFERNASMSITARLAFFINTITDELMEKNEQLEDMLYKASHDAMTGLLNRGAIERMIYDSSSLYSGTATDSWYLIMFDVDDFKMINDQCGHAQGDRILKCIARILSDYVSDIPYANAGRWGGEEFMVVVSGCDANRAKEITDTIHDKVKEESKKEKSITISVGATKHHSDESIQDTINRVDELMYEAKVMGKDQVRTDL
jgi:diguanylate cyclase (GGDEF)-like protein